MGRSQPKDNGGETLETVKDKLKNKISDYECTNFPEGNWHHCCVRHDYAYADGENKWLADARLGWCVTKKGHPIIGPLMWLGVTLFGWKPYNEHKEAREYARSINS